MTNSNSNLNEHSLFHHTPLGLVEIKGSEQGISALQFVDKTKRSSTSSSIFLSQCAKELDEYFEGKRRGFDVQLDWSGASDFYQQVWSALINIPIGETKTYGQIAAQLGKPNAARAVGRANALNRMAILVPCHRLVGTDGKLRGYAYGLDRKRALLDLETSAFGTNF